VIVQVIPAQLLFEIFQAGLFIDQQELDPGHLGKVVQVLGRDRIAETRVMRAAIDSQTPKNDWVRGSKHGWQGSTTKDLLQL